MNILNNIQSNKTNQYWIFFSVLVLLALFMMFCNGSSAEYSGYDFYFHYRRLYVLIDALQHGSYISYIDYSNVDGYGYLVKPFYSDVVLIPFAFIGLFTSVYFAYDVMIFTMTVLCGVFMYNAVNTIYKSRYAAAVSALLYAFAVYRLYDIYQRGALGEALSFTFLPIVFLGLYHIIKGNYKKWYILTIGYSLLIYSHIIASVLMFVTLLIILIVYNKILLKEPKRIVYLLLAGFVTVIIVSYYIFPVLEQMLNGSFYLDTRSPGGGAGYGKMGFDFILWGFVSGIVYPDKYIWAGIGIILTLIVFSRIFIRGNKTDALKSVDIGVIIGICFIIAISRIFPWGRFPFSLLSFIQYPWRLYEFVSFFFAVAGGYYLALLFVKYRQRIIIFTLVIVATMITTYINSENFKYLHSEKVLQIYGGDSTEEPTFFNRYHAIGGEYFPAKLPAIEFVYERGMTVDNGNETTEISNIHKEYNKTILDVNINKADTLVLPLLYYYGYNITLNGESIPFGQNDYGLIAVPVDRSGQVTAYYAGTNIQKGSFYISLIGVLALIVFVFRSKRRDKDEADN